MHSTFCRHNASAGACHSIQLEVQEQLVGLRDHQPAALALRSLFCLFEATIEQDVMWGLKQPCQTLLLCC